MTNTSIEFNSVGIKLPYWNGFSEGLVYSKRQSTYILPGSLTREEWVSHIL